MPPLRWMNRSRGSESGLYAAAYRIIRDHLLRVRLSALAGSAVHRITAAKGSLQAEPSIRSAPARDPATGPRTLIRTRYDDGGYSGGSTERPALQRLLADIRDRRIDIVVVYKVDRLTRSLADFAKLVELFDAHGVSFVSVTQQFNTTTSMGRLTLNVLLSFAQFEREVTSERIRDKIGASKRRGLWVGGMVPLGYVTRGRPVPCGRLRRFSRADG
jgi:site-specific DNA recombinase